MANPNKIAIFKNTEKQDKQPDYSGTITLTPELLQEMAKYKTMELEVSMWINEAKSGLKYQGGNVQIPRKIVKAAEGQSTSYTNQTPETIDSFPDDNPF